MLLFSAWFKIGTYVHSWHVFKKQQKSVVCLLHNVKCEIKERPENELTVTVNSKNSVPFIEGGEN